MKYFNFHPKTKYSINGISTNVIDIFRKIKLNITKSNKTTTHVTGHKILPENISYKQYKDENLSWIIPISNNIILSSDWFLPNSIKLSELETKYKNQIVYSITTLPDLIENDIIIRGLSFEGPHAYVKKWDPFFRSITAIHLDGISFDAGDNITFWRKNSTAVESISFLGMGNTLADGITTSTQIYKKTEVLDYPIQFFKGDTKISPYRSVIDTGPTDMSNGILHMNDLITGTGFTYTVLNKFNTSLLGVTFTYKTTKDLYLESDISNIKIVNKIHINTIEELMKNKFRILNKYRIYEINI